LSTVSHDIPARAENTNRRAVSFDANAGLSIAHREGPIEGGADGIALHRVVSGGRAKDRDSIGAIGPDHVPGAVRSAAADDVVMGERQEDSHGRVPEWRGAVGAHAA